ncbi:MAG: GNAT family N-acetyltransferase [Bacteroidaceae bacterium]
MKEITKATPEVCNSIKTLLADLTSRETGFDMTRLTEITANPNTRLFLACEGEEAVATYTLAAVTSPTGTKVWIEDVVVGNRWQGQGLGRMIVVDAIEKSRSLWPQSTVMLTSRPSREAANHIYKTLFSKKETNVYVLKTK